MGPYGFFFVRLSGPEHAYTAAESALREAGFEVRRLTTRGDTPGKVWISAERASTGGLDESAQAMDAEQAAGGHGFTVREYGTTVSSALDGSDRLYRTSPAET